MDRAALLKEIVEIEEALVKRYATERLRFYRPYPRQKEFHAAGAGHRERLFMAGNQLGKTIAGSMEMAMHLTGEYPDWWEGFRFDRPIVAWAAGVTGESTRDNPQRLLLGRNREWGTGAIPKHAIVGDPIMGRGVPDGVDHVRVAYRGNVAWCSTLYLKSYEKGREKWQGDTIDALWFDEEPPPDIYTEGLTRTNATGGPTFITFTPLLGMSEVVRRFLTEENPDRHVTRMTIDDVGHYSDEEKARIIASYPEYEREARVHGVPMMGSGRVYPIAEEVIRCESIALPRHWPRIAAIDFGWDHPTAAVWLAWDRDADVVYLTDCYRRAKETPIVHAAAVKARGAWIPLAWPHDGQQTEKGTGKTLASQYREQGLAMLATPAAFTDGGRSVEAGIMDILERMQTGRFRVFSHLADWWEEFRMYHRDEGKIVKEHDDLMDATRYAVMMLASSKCQDPPVDRYSRGKSHGGGPSWMSR